MVVGVVIRGTLGACGGAWWGDLTRGTYVCILLGGAMWHCVVKGQKYENGKKESDDSSNMGLPK
jgi:hypothetical protein